MYDQILLRYGELVLKKNNRKQFVNCLKQNIINIIKEEPLIEYDRMFLKYNTNNIDKLNYIFGLSSYSPVKTSKNSLDDIIKTVLSEIDDFTKTFRLSIRRNWKGFEYSSEELTHIIAKAILQHKPNLKVSLKKYDQNINIEIRKNNTYIFSKNIQGLGGLPVGITGKSLHLISGGIDSPVAAFQLMKRGVKIDLLSFITPPTTDEKTVQKLDKIVEILNQYQTSTKLYQINYTDVMNYISLVSDQSYKITLMRRSFYRIATFLAKKYKYQSISNGENLAQVASQTMESIYVISAVTDIPIFRPLLTFDKNEIIKIGEKINTYNLSIIKANETCELFAPKNPIIKPTIEKALELENELDNLIQMEKNLLINKMVKKNFSN
ncbi:tRNA uracil 4-sulfurtransferase ThiI [Mesomycoplasma neurolyticum]|uniref:Probable tRNA sulfurtransferase n=1 Tax=Mesomycoplasma neurolyticum TaxID=2120 RepID=A0A449A5Y4_9BACT|nr:tRNA uracil 4-sulfurtransferase ThiI [Mesomycoplasma neurolyticum]VEU59639.1 Probable tRNA sulfurtransferase [Mesomycoplasma neurolyticum]